MACRQRFTGASAIWRMLMVLVWLSIPCTCRDARYSEGEKFVTVPRVLRARRLEVRSMLTDASTAPGLCDSIIKPAGYPCEEITVQTLDGYLLGLQHISHGHAAKNSSSSTQKRPPVYLQHGLTQGGDNWVLNSPQQSLAYILADEGFDVWIGNLRGTRWSLGHKSLSATTDWRKFWNWSFDEHAMIDMPALLNYVHKATESQVYYVGHSQGTIMALAAMTGTGTKVLEMVKATVLLAPIAYMQHIRSPLLSVSADLMLDQIVGLFGTREFNLNNEVGAALLNTACAKPNVICDDLLTAFSGPNCCFNTSRAPYYLQWEPQSTSTKNLQHLAQMVRSGKFQKFDFGWMRNIVNYGQLSPPLYNLGVISASAKIFLVSGGQDGLADPSDVQRLVDELNCPVRSLVLPHYGHSDFVVGTQAYIDVYIPVIDYFRLNP